MFLVLLWAMLWTQDPMVEATNPVEQGYLIQRAGKDAVPPGCRSRLILFSSCVPWWHDV